MNRYDIGDEITLVATYRDESGSLVDPTAVTFVVTLPDSTTVASAVTKTGTGSYRARYIATMNGRHTYTFTASGAVVAVQSGEFKVGTPFPFTYSGSPSTSDLDAVRFLMGDTDESDPQLTDSEINWLLTQETNIYYAAAMGADTVSAKYSSVINRSVGSLSIGVGEKAERWSSLATRLRAQAAARGATPYMGGMTKSDKQYYDDKPDLERGKFDNGMMDNPGTEVEFGEINRIWR